MGLQINNQLVLFLFVRISPSIIRAKTELAIYCPMKIIKITQIAITPKTIFLIIGLAGFFNQFISKSTNNYILKIDQCITSAFSANHFL